MLGSLIAVAAVTAAALCVGRAVGSRTLVELSLWALVVAVGLLGVGGLALARFGALTPWWLAGAIGGASAVAVAAARSRPWPPLAPIRPAFVDAARPTVIVLALVTGVTLAIALALALLTPAAEPDALAYHLARAAFWLQQHGSDPVPGLRDPRIDGSPPLPGILAAVGLSLGGTAGAALVQWAATIALGIAVLGVARRLGATRPTAALAGLAVPALPIVALQAPTALTDTLLACFVTIAVYAALDPRPSSSGLLGLSVGLAIGTKLTAAPGIVVVVATAVVATTGSVRLRHLAAIGAGLLAGGLAVLGQRSGAGGSTIGGQPTGLVASIDPVALAARATRLLVDAVSLPGAIGRDALVPVVVGVGMALAGVVVRRDLRAPVVIAGGLVALVGLVPTLRDGLDRGYRKTWTVVGEPDLALLGFGHDGTPASSVEAWAGVVGAAILACGIVVGIRSIGRRRLPQAVLALAPLAWIVLLAGISEHQPAAGRFTIAAFALGLAACAPVLDRPVAAWWLVGASTVAVTLALVHAQERPLGLRLLEPADGRPSAWTRSDVDAQGVARGTRELLRAVDRNVEDTAAVAIWAYPFPEPEPQPGVVVLYPFPFFGPALDRRVTLVRDPAGAEAAGAEWAVLPRWSLPICVEGWQRVTPTRASWQLLRRAPDAACPTRPAEP